MVLAVGKSKQLNINMKNLIYIAVILLNFNSCKAQINTKMEQEIIIPKITKEFEKFDIVDYNKNKINEQRRILRDDYIYIYGSIHWL
jgi:hypothetical protein